VHRWHSGDDTGSLPALMVGGGVTVRGAGGGGVCPAGRATRRRAARWRFVSAARAAAL